MNRLPHNALVFAVSAAAALSVCAGEEPGAVSADYAVTHHTIAAGGGLSSSPHFEVVSSVDGFGVADIATSASFTIRQGYAGQLNETPVPVADHHVARPGYPLKIPKSNLLSNDLDADDPSLFFSGLPAVSANGVPLSVVGPWVLYDAGASNKLDDSFTYGVTDGIDTATGVVFISVSAFDGVTLNITLKISGADNVLHVFGIPGRAYQIQTTDDLSAPIQWSNLGTAQVAPVNGLIERTDISPPATRFYRAIEP